MHKHIITNKKKRILINKKKKILIVDDDEVITSMLATILGENAAYYVETSNDPHEAYELASSRHYDLLILDVQMPSLRGDMLFLCLGVDPYDHAGKVEQPKLLMISGALDTQKLSDSLDFVGGTSYLEKPFDAESLHSKVEWILASESHEREIPNSMEMQAAPYEMQAVPCMA